jgi:glucose/arabinose dehydrogenase
MNLLNKSVGLSGLTKSSVTLILAAALAACGSDNSSGGGSSSSGSSSSSSSTSSSSSSSTSSSSGSSSTSSSSSSSSTSSSGMPDPSGPPVNTGPPNATNQTPAFEGQTRAPEVKSNFTLKTDVVTNQLKSPWGMAELPDGRFIITQREEGTLVIVTQEGQLSDALIGAPEVYNGGQGGMLDVAVAPDFETSRLVYFSFSENRGNNQNGTSVARGKLSADEKSLEDVTVIFRQTPAWNSSLHFGSRLVFDRDGLLYVTLGERSNPEPRQQAQDRNSHLGKVIRINADGTVPEDNPFVGVANTKPEIWSYGHRNVQSAALHPETGELWTVEHGPRGGDEINRPEAGKNYGWPTITYGIDYSGAPIGSGITQQEGMEQPVYYWDPVIGPSGTTFYVGDMFPWQNNLLIGSLNPGGVVRIILNGNRVVGEERLLSEYGRVRDVEVTSDGAFWIVNDNGELVRVSR